MKCCTVCKVKKDLSQFYASRRSADGKAYRCKDCDNAARKKSRNSPGTILGYRRRNLAMKYGLTIEQYEGMLKSQDGCCAICRTNNPCGEGNKGPGKRSFSFAVDHDHQTGEIRGLLCNTCNRAIGFLRDSPDLIMEAFKYVTKRPKYGAC